MAHARARLNVFGRQLLVSRVDGQGWPVALAAESLGIRRATAYKWLQDIGRQAQEQQDLKQGDHFSDSPPTNWCHQCC